MNHTIIRKCAYLTVFVFPAALLLFGTTSSVAEASHTSAKSISARTVTPACYRIRSASTGEVLAAACSDSRTLCVGVNPSKEITCKPISSGSSYGEGSSGYGGEGSPGYYGGSPGG